MAAEAVGVSDKYVSDANDLAEGLDFDKLLMERRVEFEIVGTAKGSKAVAVRAVG